MRATFGYGECGGEHLAHAAFADLFQDAIGPQDQFAAAAMDDLAELISREAALIDQVSHQAMGVAIKKSNLFGERIPFQRRQEAAGAKRLHQGFRRFDRHVASGENYSDSTVDFAGGATALARIRPDSGSPPAPRR